MERPCVCGSNKSSWPLHDARGIYVSRVCEDCETKVKDRYRPEIFVDSSYQCDEAIDED
jgi:hypothetical protein